MHVLFSLTHQINLVPCRIRVLEDEGAFFVVLIWHDEARRRGASRSMILTPSLCTLASQIVQTFSLDPRHCHFIECFPLPLSFLADKRRWYLGGGYAHLHYTWIGTVARSLRWEVVDAQLIEQLIIPYPDVCGEDLWFFQN